MRPARAVLITGAGRGIGRAIALGLAEQTPARLLLVSKSPTARAVAEQLGPRAAAFEWDVASSGARRDEVFEALRLAEGPKAVVHCAAVLGPTGPFVDADLGAWWSAMQTNLFGAVNVVQSGLRAGAERVVLFAGGGAAYGYPGFSSYGTAKAALVRLTETLALELRGRAVVTILAPGANETDMLAEVRRAGGEVKTTVAIAEPVAAVLRLLTEDTRALHGRFLHVRDGWKEGEALPAEQFTLRRVEPKR